MSAAPIAHTAQLTCFFYWTFLDEAKAVRATQRALNRLRQLESPSDFDLAQIMLEAWKFFSKRTVPQLKTRQLLFRLPESVDIGIWQQVRTSLTKDELLALIWVAVLGLDARQVALALGLSVGTIQHRVGRALRRVAAVSEAAGIF